jgi:two-component system, NtrC family, response regulator
LYTKHLPLQVRVQIVCGSLEAPPEKTEKEAGADGGTLPDFKSYRETSERKYLQDLMSMTQRNIPKSCEISGISRSRLYEMLAKYGLNTSN